MHVFLIVLGAPALVFAIFATALGVNPIRAAAWGAILGMAAIGYFAFEAITNGRALRPQLTSGATAWTPPPTDATAPAGGALKPGAFDDLIPAAGYSANSVDPEPRKLY